MKRRRKVNDDKKDDVTAVISAEQCSEKKQARTRGRKRSLGDVNLDIHRPTTLLKRRIKKNVNRISSPVIHSYHKLNDREIDILRTELLQWFCVYRRKLPW